MTIQQVINRYFQLEGERTVTEIKNVIAAISTFKPKSEKEKVQFLFIEHKLKNILQTAQYYHPAKVMLMFGDDVFDMETMDDLEIYFDKGLGKLTDRGKTAPRGKIDEFWRKQDMKVIFNEKNKDLRKGSVLPSDFKPSSEYYLLEHFGIRGIEYGNWLNQLDRLNYLNGCALALHDLQSLLGFSAKQIGLHKLLTISFGARGSGKALAHFEPGTFAINLSRFKRESAKKIIEKGLKREERLTESGGVGSLAHEYGHALDYYAGYYIEPLKNEPLSDGQSTSTHIDKQRASTKTLRGCMERILKKIIWHPSGTKYSPYYERLSNYTKGRNYWIRRNEIFARAFEAYIVFKLSKKGWVNLYLQKMKYSPVAYLTANEMKAIERDFDELISLLRSKITPTITNKARAIIE